MKLEHIYSNTWLWIMVCTIFGTGIVLSLPGCKPSEQVKRSRALQFYNEHPAEFAKNCADAFPVKDSIGEDVIDSIKTADNIDLSQWLNSLYTELDNLKDRFAKDTTDMARHYTDQINTLVARVNAVNREYKPCLPEVIYKTRPVYQENTARIKALGAQIDSLFQDGIKCKEREREALKQAEKYEKRASTRLWAIIAIGTVILGYVVLQIKRIL
jgi:hypothetical protein